MVRELGGGDCLEGWERRFEGGGVGGGGLGVVVRGGGGGCTCSQFSHLTDCSLQHCFCTLTSFLACVCCFFLPSAYPQTDTVQLYNTQPDSCTHMDRTDCLCETKTVHTVILKSYRGVVWGTGAGEKGERGGLGRLANKSLMRFCQVGRKIFK